MIDLDLYVSLQDRLKSLIGEAKKCKRLSSKVGEMQIGGSAYERANNKLHHDFMSLHKQENMFLRFIEKNLPKFNEDEIYASSSWHGKTIK